MVKIAYVLWIVLAIITAATYVIGIGGHIVTLALATRLSIPTQLAIHAAIPVVLTAVKLGTVPGMAMLTPLAVQHPNFQRWRQRLARLTTRGKS